MAQYKLLKASAGAKVLQDKEDAESARNEAVAAKGEANRDATDALDAATTATNAANTATSASAEALAASTLDGSVASHADLPAAGSHTGETYLVRMDETATPDRPCALYTSDGSTWSYDGQALLSEASRDQGGGFLSSEANGKAKTQALSREHKGQSERWGTAMQGLQRRPTAVPRGGSAETMVESSSDYDAFGTCEMMDSGRFVLVARRGTDHLNGGSIYQWGSYDVGKTWTAGREIITPPDAANYSDLRDPRLLRLSNDDLLLAVNEFDPSTSTQGDTYVYKSTDEGDTWTLISTISEASYRFPWQMIELPNGDILMAAYNVGTVYVLKSTDGGQTWTQQGSMAHPSVNECAIQYLDEAGTELVIVARQEEGGNHLGLTQFRSVDSAATWTHEGDVYVSLNDAAAPCLRRHKGRLYLAWGSRRDMSIHIASAPLGAGEAGPDDWDMHPSPFSSAIPFTDYGDFSYPWLAIGEWGATLTLYNGNGSGGADLHALQVGRILAERMGEAQEGRVLAYSPGEPYDQAHARPAGFLNAASILNKVTMRRYPYDVVQELPGYVAFFDFNKSGSVTTDANSNAETITDITGTLSETQAEATRRAAYTGGGIVFDGVDDEYYPDVDFTAAAEATICALVDIPAATFTIASQYDGTLPSEGGVLLQASGDRTPAYAATYGRPSGGTDWKDYAGVKAPFSGWLAMTYRDGLFRLFTEGKSNFSVIQGDYHTNKTNIKLGGAYGVNEHTAGTLRCVGFFDQALDEYEAQLLGELLKILKP